MRIRNRKETNKNIKLKQAKNGALWNTCESCFPTAEIVLNKSGARMQCTFENCVVVPKIIINI